MSNLLARYAEAALWLGRYVERAESIARVIDVNDTFSRNSRGIADWDAVLQLYGDKQRFQELHGDVTAEKVVHFYLLDKENPGSVRSSIRFARENARTLRPMISSEVWEQLNSFSHRVNRLDNAVLESPGLYRVCNLIKEHCQMHSGVVEATMYRDETWYFHRLGQQLERGAQTAHYLDVRYRDLQPTKQSDPDAVDLIQWMALLRSQAALHGYRRTTRKGVSPQRVAEFLLFNPHFPRSVISCVSELESTFARLQQEFSISAGESSRQAIRQLAARMQKRTIEQVIDAGLHEYLDDIQRELYAVSDQLHADFFFAQAA